MWISQLWGLSLIVVRETRLLLIKGKTSSCISTNGAEKNKFGLINKFYQKQAELMKIVGESHKMQNKCRWKYRLKYKTKKQALIIIN